MNKWLLLVAKPLLKNLAKRAIRSQEENLKNELKDRLAKDGPHALDSVIDNLQEKLQSIARKAMPDWSWLKPWEEKLVAIIEDNGNILQADLNKKVVESGPAAIDLVLDKALLILLQRIDSI